MAEDMSICVNGQSQVPPGFRFHPTEEELLLYYLGKKVSYEKIDLDVIREVDLNKLEPWDIQERCKIGSTPQNDWYFFSHKDKKYPTGTRTNRATTAGFWKATGRDKVIQSNGRRIGMRKTLVFYKGRAPHGKKSDWIMHEYRLDDNTTCDTNHVSISMGEATQEEGWVVCRIFKKKNHHKAQVDSPITSFSINTTETRTTQKLMINSSHQGTLEQIFQYMGNTCKDEEDDVDDDQVDNTKLFLTPMDLHERFMKLPSLESPKYSINNNTQDCNYQQTQAQMFNDINDVSMTTVQVMSGHPNTPYQTGLNNNNNNWSELDQLIASQLNDPTNMPFFSAVDHDIQLQQIRSSPPSNQLDFWSFSGSSLSSTEPLCHMPNAPV